MTHLVLGAVVLTAFFLGGLVGAWWMGRRDEQDMKRTMRRLAYFPDPGRYNGVAN